LAAILVRAGRRFDAGWHDVGHGLPPAASSSQPRPATQASLPAVRNPVSSISLVASGQTHAISIAKMCIETVLVLTAVPLTSGSVTEATVLPAVSGTVAANTLGVRAAPFVVRLK
jgi:hypothetical protein